MNNFQRACSRYLTKDMIKLLSYNQKVDMINFIVKQNKGDRDYEKATGKGSIDNTGDSLKDIGETINSLPMTARQKEIARYREQRYTLDEIADLLSVSERTINNEILAIRAIIDDNKDMMAVEATVWHKKTSGQYDE